MSRDFSYCEHCTTGLAAFWTKTNGMYLQTCTDCYDDVHATAPNNTMVVHDTPGRYNYEQLCTALTANDISPALARTLIATLPEPVRTH